MSERVLIVIPAYNESKNIAAVLADLRCEAPDYDRVVVDDGSKDPTAEIVAGLGEKLLALPVNLGYGHAVQAGLKYALECGYDVMVTMDADGQHQPQDVERLVHAIQESNSAMVIGSRFCEAGVYVTPLYRRLGQMFFSHLTRVMIGERIYDTSSGFKALRPEACRLIVAGSFMDFHLETIVQLSLRKYSIDEVPVTVRERQHGQSMHSVYSIFHYPLKTLLLTFVAFMDAYVHARVVRKK